MLKLHSIGVLIFTFEVLFVAKVFCGPLPNFIQLSKEKITSLKKLGQQMQETLSNDVDPCVNFHEYACANNSRTINDEPDFNKVFDALENYLSKTEHLTEAEIRLRDYLTSCKNSGEEDLRMIVREFYFAESIGGWPAFDSNWKGDKFNLQTAIAELQTFDTPAIIDQSCVTGWGNVKEQYSVGLRNFNLTFGTRKKAQLKERLLKVGVENVQEVINDAAKVEKKCLAALYDFDWVEEYKVETNFSGLKRKIPEIDWDRQVRTITGRELEDTFPVVITFSKALRKVITTVSKMDPKIVANYLFCNFVSNLPTVKKDEIKRTCLSHALNNFRPVIAGIFVRKFFNADTKTILTDMIVTSLENVDKYLHIFKDTSRNHHMVASDIINNVIPSISLLEYEYYEVEISPDSFVVNTFRLRNFKRKNPVGICSDSLLCSSEILIKMLITLFSTNLYDVTNIPSTVVYETVYIYFVAEFVESMFDTKKFSNSSLGCFKQQLKPVEVNDWLLLNNLILQIYFKSYTSWAGRNMDVIQAENEVLAEYGLSSQRIILVRIMQYMSCDRNAGTMKRISSPFWNLQEFSKMYNCPLGSPMNPKAKCSFENTDLIVP